MPVIRSEFDQIKIGSLTRFIHPKSRLRQRWQPELGNLPKKSSEILEGLPGRWKRSVRAVSLGKDAIVQAEPSRLRAVSQFLRVADSVC